MSPWKLSKESESELLLKPLSIIFFLLFGIGCIIGSLFILTNPWTWYISLILFLPGIFFIWSCTDTIKFELNNPPGYVTVIEKSIFNTKKHVISKRNALAYSVYDRYLSLRGDYGTISHTSYVLTMATGNGKLLEIDCGTNRELPNHIMTKILSTVSDSDIICDDKNNIIISALENNICSNCGEEVQIGTKFCTNCGAAIPAIPSSLVENQVATPIIQEKTTPKITQTESEKIIMSCPHCGKQLSKKVKFCTQCGTLIEVQTPSRDNL